MPLRSKPKTRPGTLDDPVTTVEPLVLPTAEAVTAAPKLEVKAQTVETLTQMYPSNGICQKSLGWSSFVEAMADAGFAVTHGSGSAVSFKQRDGKVIVFHRPHPRPTIEPIMLRVFGKRLRRHFGWEQATFVEGDKEAA